MDYAETASDPTLGTGAGTAGTLSPKAWKVTWRRILDQFSYSYVLAMLKLGETDAALDMVERGYNLRDPTMVYLPIYSLELLYADARFQHLVKRMNLPPPARVGWPRPFSRRAVFHPLTG